MHYEYGPDRLPTWYPLTITGHKILANGAVYHDVTWDPHERWNPDWDMDKFKSFNFKAKTAPHWRYMQDVPKQRAAPPPAATDGPAARTRQRDIAHVLSAVDAGVDLDVAAYAVMGDAGEAFADEAHGNVQRFHDTIMHATDVDSSPSRTSELNAATISTQTWQPFVMPEQTISSVV